MLYIMIVRVVKKC